MCILDAFDKAVQFKIEVKVDFFPLSACLHWIRFGVSLPMPFPLRLGRFFLPGDGWVSITNGEWEDTPFDSVDEVKLGGLYFYANALLYLNTILNFIAIVLLMVSYVYFCKGYVSNLLSFGFVLRVGVLSSSWSHLVRGSVSWGIASIWLACGAFSWVIHVRGPSPCGQCHLCAGSSWFV